MKIKLKNKQIVQSGSSKEKIDLQSVFAISCKTNRGLSTLAHNIVFERFTKKNNTLERKMDHDKFYEPIAFSYYEKSFKFLCYDIKVGPCYLVIDERNYVLRASPDSKVILNDSYAMLEVKCSEEYKNVDPKIV